MNLYQRLFAKDSESGIFLLIDPDGKSLDDLVPMAIEAQELGVKAFLIGGSFISDGDFNQVVKSIKEAVRIPVVLFPGNSRQISPYADGIFFMSLISGRNAQFLIGEQVMAAPYVMSYNLEAIPMGYMLIESGTVTSAEFISNTKPIPRVKIGIAVAHSQAAMLLGMKVLYLETGSGAGQPVPSEMIAAIASKVDLPIIVGGGITDPDQVQSAIQAGARAVVIGTVVEKMGISIVNQLIKAIK